MALLNRHPETLDQLDPQKVPGPDDRPPPEGAPYRVEAAEMLALPDGPLAGESKALGLDELSDKVDSRRKACQGHVDDDTDRERANSVVVASSTIDESGWDICAWYLSMTFHSTSWGIYVRNDCVNSIAVQILNHHYPPKDIVAKPTPEVVGDIRGLASAVLLLHEHFHHRVESYACSVDVHSQDLYRTYFDNVYRPSFSNGGAREEALANAHAYRSIRTVLPGRPRFSTELQRIAREYMEASFLRAPDGYKDAMKYVSRKDWTAGLAIFADEVVPHTRSTHPGQTAASGPHWVTHRFRALKGLSSVPLFLVV